MGYNDFINDIIQTRGRFGCEQSYCERHHIIPKCKGGNDEENNLIDLFAEEHFIAHKLLADENPDDFQLQYAYLLMAFVDGHDGNRYELSPQEYADARERCRIIFSGSNNPSARKVIRLCDNKIYDTVRDCETDNKISWSTLHHMLKQNRRFVYLDVWNSYTDEQKNKVLHIDWEQIEHNNRSKACNHVGCNNPRSRRVYCPQLNETFWGATEAQQKYGISKDKICMVANGQRKHAGKHPITGEKLTWIYLEKLS